MSVLEAHSKVVLNVPEPGLSPADMIDRATAMIPVLRQRQAQAEAEGRLLEVTNQEFLEAGFYRVVQPRRFGGYEFELTTYVKLMMEIARGCPSSAWVLALVSGHPIMLADFDIRAQEEAYGETGDYRCPSVGSPVLMEREGRLGLCLGLRRFDPCDGQRNGARR